MLAITALRCFRIGAFCVLLSVPAAAQNRSIALPPTPLSPTQMQECDQLQSEWDNLQQQLQTEHQNCLDAHAREQGRPSGSSPGSPCSHAECQSLHDAVYSTVEPQSQSSVQQCRDEVSQYQQQQSQEQAATQQAVQLAQQELQQQVDEFRAQGQRLSQQAGQRQAAQQSAIQQMRNQQVSQQAAFDQMQSQMKDEAQAKVDELQAQQKDTESSSSTTLDLVKPGNDQIGESSDAPADSHQNDNESFAASSASASLPVDAAATPDQMPPIPSQALTSSDPQVQAKVQELARLDQMYVDNQSFKTDLAKNADEDAQAALLAAPYGVLEMLKGAADGTASYIGSLPDPLSKTFAAGYGIVTNLAGEISKSFAEEPGTSEGVNGSLEAQGKIAEGTTTLGELIRKNPSATAAEQAVGGSLQATGQAASITVNAAQAYSAYNQGKYFDATTNATAAAGGTVSLVGQGAEIAAAPWANAASEYGNQITAAAGIAQAGQTFVQGATDTWNNITTAMASQQRYSDVMSSANALDQKILDQRAARYAELMNLLQSPNGVVYINQPPSSLSNQGDTTVVVPQP